MLFSRPHVVILLAALSSVLAQQDQAPAFLGWNKDLPHPADLEHPIVDPPSPVEEEREYFRKHFLDPPKDQAPKLIDPKYLIVDPPPPGEELRESLGWKHLQPPADHQAPKDQAPKFDVDPELPYVDPPSPIPIEELSEELKKYFRRHPPGLEDLRVRPLQSRR